MKVLLSAHGNPDFGEPRDLGVEPQWVRVNNLVEASSVCVNWLCEHGYGSGNWTGGEVRVDGVDVAHVSYNGRVWRGAECAYDPWK